MEEDTRNEFQKKIGVGEKQYLFGRYVGSTKRVDVITEEGPRRGKVGGYHTEHWDGRVDATVNAPHIKVRAGTTEE